VPEGANGTIDTLKNTFIKQKNRQQITVGQVSLLANEITGFF
jgi:hypothetical protein